MLRILHTADWHIGRFLNSYSLLEDQQHFLEWLFRLLKEEGVDILIIAGDIYNTASPSAAAVCVLDEFFSKVVLELKKKILIIAGNHDSPEKLGFSSNILEKEGLFIASSLKNIKTVNFDGGCSVFVTLLPYINSAMIKENFKKEKISNFNESMNFVYERYLKKNVNNGINILVAHGLFFDIAGEDLKYCDSEIEIGGCDPANLNIFKDFSYIALGHLHKPQKAGPNGFYSGSPLKYSISEAGDEKQVILVEVFDDFKIEKKFIPYKPLRDLVVKTGRFHDLKKIRTDDFVAIKLTDENFILDPYNRLKKNYPNLLEIEFLNLNFQLKKRFKVIKNKAPIELFKEFYREVVGKDMKEREEEFLEEIVKLEQKED